MYELIGFFVYFFLKVFLYKKYKKDIFVLIRNTKLSDLVGIIIIYFTISAFIVVMAWPFVLIIFGIFYLADKLRTYAEKQGK